MSAATKIAENLLEISAVKLDIARPFTWASGWKSPIYCDNRRALGSLPARNLINSELTAAIQTNFPAAQSIAGVATAGISWGAMTADRLQLPFLYVRPKPKEHGMGNQIEGMYKAGDRVVVIEDLISTGKSSLQVCEVLRAQEIIVEGMIAIFTYDFRQADSAFAAAGVKLVALSNYAELIQVAGRKGMLKGDELNSLLNWREAPDNWGK